MKTYAKLSSLPILHSVVAWEDKPSKHGVKEIIKKKIASVKAKMT